MKNDNKGFSLIELIVVIAIMAILVGVMAPQVIKYIESSRQSTDMQNAAAMRTAIEVGVADGAITYDVTLTIANGKVSVTGGTGDALKTTLESMGMTNEITLKSAGWTAAKLAEYKVANYKWVPGAANVNANQPANDLTNAFK